VHLTPAQRQADSRRKMEIWHLHHNARNIAMGFTGSGRPRSARQKPRALSPELQRMVAIYKRKLARSARPKELPPLEAAWRSFRSEISHRDTENPETGIPECTC